MDIVRSCVQPVASGLIFSVLGKGVCHSGYNLLVHIEASEGSKWVWHVDWSLIGLDAADLIEQYLT